ncbi:hypothetical protein C8J57DRAFT_1540828 [Mycena rebaudengoi]|nr:hypothetical protein C8J57DRAFT_1540828 [Mycena rebaudengoi]
MLTDAEWTRAVDNAQDGIPDSQMRRMDFSQLWNTSMRSVAHHFMVLDFMIRTGPWPPCGIEPGGLWGRLPVELTTEIMGHMSLRERTLFSQTSRYTRWIASRELQRKAADCLRPYTLRFADIQLLLRASNSIIGGATIPTLLHDVPHPAPLAFYCKAGGAERVVDFLLLAAHDANYELYTIGEGAEAEGTLAIWTLHAHNYPLIHVIETASQNPADCVFHMPTSLSMGYWSSRAFFHAYPRATLRSVAFTTPSQLPLDDLSQRQRAWEVMHEQPHHQYEFEGELHEPHLCGQHPECPATLRNTLDAGCLRIPFPQYNVGIRGRRNSGDAPHMSWMLGNAACHATMWGARGGRLLPILPYTRHKYVQWKTALDTILSLEEVPLTDGSDDAEGSDDDSVRADEHDDDGDALDKALGMSSLARRLPREILSHIMSYLPLSDRARFGATSRHGRWILSMSLQDKAVALLRPYTLHFPDVQLLQRMTGAVVSGATVASLIRDLAFFPHSLEFYCAYGQGQTVVDFLLLAASDGDYHGDTVLMTVDEENHGGLDSEPLYCVLSQPASVLMGAWTASHLWHGYPEATLRSIALSSPVRIPLNDSGQCTRAFEILSEWHSWRYDFVADLQEVHRCGQALQCPATVRNTTDNGCLRLPLPRYGRTSSSNLGDHMPTDVSWMMGASPCAGSDRDAVLPHSHRQLVIWKHTVDELLDEYADGRSTPQQYH